MGKECLNLVFEQEKNNSTSPASSCYSSSASSTASSSNDFSSGDAINKIKLMAKNCFNVIQLKNVAFREIKMPKRRVIAAKRAFYVRQLKSMAASYSVDQSHESTMQWIKRRSRELISPTPVPLTSGPSIDSLRIVMSEDSAKIAVLNSKESVVELFDSSADGLSSRRISLKHLSPFFPDTDCNKRSKSSSGSDVPNLMLARVSCPGDQLIFLHDISDALSDKKAAGNKKNVAFGWRTRDGDTNDSTIRSVSLKSFLVPSSSRCCNSRTSDHESQNNRSKDDDEILCHVISYPCEKIFKTFHREPFNDFIILSTDGQVTRFDLEQDDISVGRGIESVHLMDRNKNSGSVVAAAALDQTSSSLLIHISSQFVPCPDSLAPSPLILMHHLQSHQQQEQQSPAKVCSEGDETMRFHGAGGIVSSCCSRNEHLLSNVPLSQRKASLAEPLDNTSQEPAATLSMDQLLVVDLNSLDVYDQIHLGCDLSC